MFDAWPIIFDISRPIRPELPVWPGDPPFEMNWISRMADGDSANIAQLHIGVHTGTHVDAPRHLLEQGPAVDELILNAFLGKARLVDARGRGVLDVAFINSVLARSEDAKRILFRTGAWEATTGFPTVFPALEPAAAEALIAAGIRLIGTDAPSVDPLDSLELPAHHALLAAGIPILENLQLEEPAFGEYELIALPLPVTGADASPVRAVLRTL
ncbi:MAG: cyclase family protein [Gemmatimonadota bacterium]|jgi:arylformamidase|nr:cyclase family protein [Gemmatimonadota bacterium]